VSATSAAVLLVVGFAASTINTLAGGGSFLTLPLLMFMGLPAAAANATNRLGVLTQNVGAVWGFHRHGVLDWGWALGAAVPTAVGSALGAWLALGIGDREFKRILAFLMIGICLWTLVDGARSAKQAAEGALVHRPWLVRVGFFLAGIYGGFIQAGIGFLVLALTTLAGFDLVRGNAVKVLAVLLQTLVALAVFLTAGQVRWAEGACLAVGGLLGSLLGVHLTVLKGHRWLKAVVTVTMVLFAIRLLFE
jgi:uncharacterized membrane protein YfcA